MAKKKPRQQAKPTKSEWSVQDQNAICKIVNTGISYGLPASATIVALCEAFPTMNKYKAMWWIRDCKKKITVSPELLSTEEDNNRGLLIMRYECIYGSAMERGDLKTALAAAKELGAIQGIMNEVKQQAKPFNRTNIVTTHNVLAIPQTTIDNLDALTDTQLRIGLSKGELSDEQADFLFKASRGLDTEGDNT